MNLCWFATGDKALYWSDSSEVVVCALSAFHAGSFKAATSLPSDTQGGLRAEQSHGCWAICGEHALGQLFAIDIQTRESILCRVHNTGVRDDLPDERFAFVVQDGRLLWSRWLEALVLGEIWGGLGLSWFKIADNVFVTSQELLLDIPGVDHGWSLNSLVELHLSGRVVSMLWAYLEILHFRSEVALDAPGGGWHHFYLRVVLVPPNTVCMDAVQDFIKSWKRYVKLSVRGVVLLARGDLSELALDIGIHFADCEEDAPRQLLLIVQSEPLGE